MDNVVKRRIDGTRALTTGGEPYPRQVTGGDSDFSGTVNFINWNGPVSAVAPADTIDVEAPFMPWVEGRSPPQPESSHLHAGSGAGPVEGHGPISIPHTFP